MYTVCSLWPKDQYLKIAEWLWSQSDRGYSPTHSEKKKEEGKNEIYDAGKKYAPFLIFVQT